jgi:hypothetical protein
MSKVKTPMRYRLDIIKKYYPKEYKELIKLLKNKDKDGIN